MSSHITQLKKVLLENGWNSKRMITEGDAAIPLETTRRAFRNQEKSKQSSAIGEMKLSKNIFHFLLISLYISPIKQLSY